MFDPGQGLALQRLQGCLIPGQIASQGGQLFWLHGQHACAAVLTVGQDPRGMQLPAGTPASGFAALALELNDGPPDKDRRGFEFG